VMDLSDYKRGAAFGLPGPKIVLGLGGEVAVGLGADRVTLRPGRGVFAASREAALTLSGGGRVAIASVGKQI
jgi:hypothetical protein